MCHRNVYVSSQCSRAKPHSNPQTSEPIRCKAYLKEAIHAHRKRFGFCKSTISLNGRRLDYHPDDDVAWLQEYGETHTCNGRSVERRMLLRSGPCGQCQGRAIEPDESHAPSRHSRASSRRDRYAATSSSSRRDDYSEFSELTYAPRRPRSLDIHSATHVSDAEISSLASTLQSTRIRPRIITVSPKAAKFDEGLLPYESSGPRTNATSEISGLPYTNHGDSLSKLGNVLPYVEAGLLPYEGERQHEIESKKQSSGSAHADSKASTSYYSRDSRSTRYETSEARSHHTKRSSKRVSYLNAIDEEIRPEDSISQVPQRSTHGHRSHARSHRDSGRHERYESRYVETHPPLTDSRAGSRYSHQYTHRSHRDQTRYAPRFDISTDHGASQLSGSRHHHREPHRRSHTDARYNSRYSYDF